MQLVWILMVWQVNGAFYMPTHAYQTEIACQQVAKDIPRGWGVRGNPAPPICMAVSFSATRDGGA